jgi:hypothetical protein
MNLALRLDQVLKEPTPQNLWKLHPSLLVIDHPSADAASNIAGQFFRYLSLIQSKLESRQFPILATTLAISGTGIGMAENIFSSRKTNIMELLVDGLRVALDTLSTYQFVRQWEPDFATLHDTAVWDLYRSFWQLSEDLQPDLDTTKRVELLDDLFRAVRDPESDGSLRLALLVRLFQWGLAVRVLPLLAEPSPAS